MMKPPMPKGGDVKMGGHSKMEPKLDSSDHKDLMKVDGPHKGMAKPPSGANERKSGGPGLKSVGMSHACSTLSKMKP